jgi:hypothetical protein
MAIVQWHHIIYPGDKNKEVLVRIFKGEHHILTLMQLYTPNKVSAGFIKALKIFIAFNEDRSIELNEQNKNNKKG